MPLPSFFQRKAKAPKTAAIAEDTGPVQEARVRARRRLIGAVVLLAAGIVGFPLLFETKPRPMPVDVPIDLARKDAPLQRPARVLPPPTVDLPADAGNETPSTAMTTPVAPVAPDVKAVAASAADDAKPASVPMPAAKPSVPAAKPSAPAPKPASPAKPADNAPRTPPAIEPRSASASAPAPASSDSRAGRFVVQVGAYTDLGAMRDARQRVEKLGFKTYTQEVDTPSGRRTRLRVGPFNSRSDAEAAGTRLKAVGMPGNLLVL